MIIYIWFLAAGDTYSGYLLRSPQPSFFFLRIFVPHVPPPIPSRHHLEAICRVKGTASLTIWRICNENWKGLAYSGLCTWSEVILIQELWQNHLLPHIETEKARYLREEKKHEINKHYHQQPTGNFQTSIGRGNLNRDRSVTELR